MAANRQNNYRRNMQSWGRTSGSNQDSASRQSEGVMDSYAERSSQGQQHPPRRQNRRPVSNPLRGPPRKGDDFPAPSHLSKTESQLKNDPLYEEAFFPSPLEELKPMSKEDFFYPGCDGFTQISHEIFSELTAHDYNYKRNVPECAHEYYLGILLYARLLELHRSNHGTLSYHQSEFLSAIDTGKYQMPLSFHRYLSGFGNNNLPSGKEQIFAIRDLPIEEDPETHLSGYFGNIADNSGLYTSYVCPAILAQKIKECLRYTNTNHQPDWNLPEGLAYMDEIGITYALNEKCLGYSPAIQLSRDQVGFLANQGITQTQFRCYADVPFHSALMNGIAQYLSEIHDLMLVGMPTTTAGSQGQFVSVTPLTNGRTEVLIPQSAYNIIGSLAYLGAGYQYFKIKAKTKECWPNTFPTIVTPSEEYIASITWPQDHVDPKLLRYDYVSHEFDPHIRGKEIVKYDMKIHNR